MDLLAGRQRSRYGSGGTYRAEEYAERLTGTQIAALCDVNMRRAGDAFDVYSDAAEYNDYRRMLDEMDGDVGIEIILILAYLHYGRA